MSEERWGAVDDYVASLLASHDEVLEAALRAGVEAGLPQIQVSPPQGKLLQVLVQAIGARSVLEFGTLAGYSTIWLGRALPSDGRLVTLEAAIVADNVVRDGTLADAGDDPIALAQRRLHEMIAADASVTATTIQTVGAKGYDGFTIALVAA